MIKLSHKKLKRLGNNLNGHYFDGNIYDHENRVYYLQTITFRKEETISHLVATNENSAFISLLKSIAALNPDSSSSKQLAYSCGLYGNTGQLHEISYYKHDNLIKTIYIYC